MQLHIFNLPAVELSWVAEPGVAVESSPAATGAADVSARFWHDDGPDVK